MAAFVLSAFILAMLPGPATALLVREVVGGDQRRVIGVIGGIEVGIFAWAVLSGLGVAALVAASALAYTVLRAVGAAILVLLGLQTLWYSWKHRPEKPRPVMRLRGFRGGLVTNLANPKAAVFAFSFYPQFIPHGSHVLLTSMILGTVHVCVDVAWYSVRVPGGQSKYHDRNRSSRCAGSAPSSGFIGAFGKPAVWSRR